MRCRYTKRVRECIVIRNHPRFGLLPWHDGDAARCAGQCFYPVDRWLDVSLIGTVRLAAAVAVDEEKVDFAGTLLYGCFDTAASVEVWLWIGKR